MVGAPSFPQPYIYHPYNLYQKFVPLFQSIFFSLYHPYSFTKSSLQSRLTLPFTIPQQFSPPCFLHTTIPKIYTKNIFSTSGINPIQSESKDQGPREYYEDWHIFNLFLLRQSVENDSRVHNSWLLIAQAQKIGI